MQRKGVMLFRIAEVLFLLGVAFLVVRKNTYPWPVKRASDLFFLFSALVALVTFFFDRTRKVFLQKIKKPLAGLALIFCGIGIAALAAYVLQGTAIDADGLLSLARFAEVALIFILVSFFQHHHKTFYRFAAFAQLSTLIYAFILIAPDTLYSDPAALERFRLFENWPSNVGYYLVVSLCFIMVQTVKSLNPFHARFFIYYIGGVGLSAILLWTGSRASWLGVAVAAIFILSLSHYRLSAGIKRIITASLIMVSLPLVGFPFLPQYAQNFARMRTFSPPVQTSQNTEILSNETNAPATSYPAETREDNGRSVNRADIQDRFSLWHIYTKRILASPLGLGPNYKPEIINENAKGPHNTLLEMLVIAGPLGLAGFIYLFFLAFRNLARVFRSEREWRWTIYLAAALTGLVITSFFDNMSTFRLMWLVLALGIFLEPRYTPTHSGLL